MSKNELVKALNSPSMTFTLREIRQLMDDELEKSPDEMDTETVDLCARLLHEKLNVKGADTEVRTKKPRRLTSKTAGRLVLIAAVLLAACCVGIPSFAQYSSLAARNPGLPDDYIPTSREEIDKMNFRELLNGLNKLDFSFDMPELDDYMSALREKVKDATDKELVDAFTDPHNSAEVRTALIELAPESAKESAKEKLRALLEKKSVSFDVRAEALSALEELRDVDALVRTAAGDDEMLAFDALRYLSWIAPERLSEMLPDILNSYNGVMNERIRGAIVFSGELFKQGFAKTKPEEFVSFCERVLTDLPDSEARAGVTTAISVGFALEDMHCKEGVSCLLRHKEITDTIRYGAVTSNLDVLLSLKSPDMTVEDAETLIAAVRVNPQTELVAALSEIRSDPPGAIAGNDAIAQRIEIALDEAVAQADD